MRSHLKTFAAFALLLLVSWPAGAIDKDVKKEAKAKLKGTLFMRINAPHMQGRHAYGTYNKALVEVSPDGTNTDGSVKVEGGFWHMASTQWEVRVNDSVEVDDLDFDDDEIKIDLEGVGRSDGNDTAIKLVRIRSVDDFNKAFDRAFALKPLQDEHDWPSEIKDAIANRTLQDGMTKRQAYCITGFPDSSDTEEEGGEKIETWYLADAFGLPRRIKFYDGVLRGAGTSSGGGVSLDD